MGHPFDQLPGVVSVTAGYTGGQKKDITYKEVSAGETCHAESVQIVYDPTKISHERLLEVLWHNSAMPGINIAVQSSTTMRNSGGLRCNQKSS